MPAFREDFYICNDCGSGVFSEEVHLVVRHDPDYLHQDDYRTVQAMVRIREYKYKCVECGTYLHRGNRR